MAANVLITGASGYLGSALLSQIRQTPLAHTGTLYASVRSDEQAAAVKDYGFEPLALNLRDGAPIEAGVVDHNISAVFWLVDAMSVDAQLHFLRALAAVKARTGRAVHFLHTSGAKVFSNLAGASTDETLLDSAVDLYDRQKAQRAEFDFLQQALETNNAIVEQGLALGVHTYIFVPCIVYGQHRGFGNPISIQTVAVVKAAKAARRVHRVDNGRPMWPVCHVEDTANLYHAILNKILSGVAIDSGKQGYYLAASGSVAWDDIYDAFAAALARRQVIDSTEVSFADDDALEKMSQGLGCPKELVRVQLGGRCTMEAKRGVSLGWRPERRAEHILEAADAEVELVLEHLSSTH